MSSTGPAVGQDELCPQTLLLAPLLLAPPQQERPLPELVLQALPLLELLLPVLQAASGYGQLPLADELFSAAKSRCCQWKLLDELRLQPGLYMIGVQVLPHQPAVQAPLQLSRQQMM
mmetsp:Transcript_34905/g.61760  ORF Transcript_34905/g.61760 Transcript_34905/m.61760 type:complete len:117 (-) Transcript_34905:342-692(-)